jgi:polysaccharide deacetylase 2 family uncharacterized protein YibQ
VPKKRAFFLILFFCLCIPSFFGVYSFSNSRKAVSPKMSQPVLNIPYSVSSITQFAIQKRSRVALIIDDVGENLELLEEVSQLSFPVTISVLPGSPHDAESAGWAKRHGLEVMVHLPMEPEAYPLKDPGKNSILLSMNQRKLREATLDLIEEIPYASGINNHMGSRFTQSNMKMAPVLDMIAAKNLYFVDSRTTPLSVAYKMAQLKSIPSAERTLFIDESAQEISDRLVELIQLGQSDDGSIGIAHLRSSTLNVLKKIDADSLRNVEFVFASELCGVKASRKVAKAQRKN